jgi:hypothetical protein
MCWDQNHSNLGLINLYFHKFTNATSKKFEFYSQKIKVKILIKHRKIKKKKKKNHNNISKIEEHIKLDFWIHSFKLSVQHTLFYDERYIIAQFFIFFSFLTSVFSFFYPSVKK